MALLAGCAGRFGGPRFEPLFDGSTLRGWHALPGGNWEARDGVLVGTSTKDESRHGLLVTDKRFRDFTVLFQFRVLEGNSGFYFRVDEVDSGVGAHGFQAEVDKTLATGGLYETGGRGWVVQPDQDAMKAWSRPYVPGEWADMIISAYGGDITVTVNGLKTAELRDDPGRREGHIGLQLHGGADMHVEFKNIEIHEAAE